MGDRLNKGALEKTNRFFSSYTTIIVLMLIFALIIAAVTIVEKYLGSDIARRYFYHSPLLFLLMAAMVVNFFCVSFKHELFRKKKWGWLFIHLAFVVILAGALVSHITGKEGMMHIRQGETTDMVYLNEGDIEKLPFTLRLDKFILSRYPGSDSPSSYQSDVTVIAGGTVHHASILMNNVLTVEGYRFFQASFDQDEQGTLLMVNHDVAGQYITYTGYLLLLIGFLLFLFCKKSRLRKLLCQLNEIHRGGSGLLAFLGLCLFCTAFVQAQNPQESLLQSVQKYAVNRKHAAQFGALPMQSSDGRIIPVNTFSSEVLRKLHKKTSFGRLNADQFLLSVMSMPEVWTDIPFIEVGDDRISALFGLSRLQCAYSQAFDADGSYKLRQRVADVYAKSPASRTAFDRDLIKLDERLNLFNAITCHSLLRLFPQPGDSTHRWFAAGDMVQDSTDANVVFAKRFMEWYLTDVHIALRNGKWNDPNEDLNQIKDYQRTHAGGLVVDAGKLRAELLYNRLDLFNFCKTGYLLMGGLLLIIAFIGYSRDGDRLDKVYSILSLCALLLLVLHIFGLGLRWYISGYAPWSNSYETMVYAALTSVIAGLVFVRGNRIVFPLAVLFGGIILFVSSLNWMDPQIGTLVPVLKSPWLMFHVAVVVAAYGFFGISALLGLTCLILMICYRKNEGSMIGIHIRELTIVNELSLWIGITLMAVGIFLGAVWANESWGNYWSWDPKESWALVTLIVYAVVLHLRLLRRGEMTWLFNFCSVFSILTVLMTFFGVNYFLSGMHSYGMSEEVPGVSIYVGASTIAVLLLGLIARRRYHRIQTNNNSNNLNHATDQ